MQIFQERSYNIQIIQSQMAFSYQIADIKILDKFKIRPYSTVCLRILSRSIAGASGELEDQLSFFASDLNLHCILISFFVEG